MKKAFCGLLMLLTFTAVCYAQADNSKENQKSEGNVILKAGTLLTAQLQEALDVQTSQSNDDFVLKLTEDIINGPLTIPKDTELLGRVVSVKPISSDNNVSELSLSFDFLRLLEDFLTFKASILSVTTGDSASDSENKISKPDCASSPIFKGATIISAKGRNVRLEPGTIFKLKVSRDVVIP